LGHGIVGFLLAFAINEQADVTFNVDRKGLQDRLVWSFNEKLKVQRPDFPRPR
jgi:hypothetical protein